MSVKLVILGLLLEGDKHPYEIQQIINERQMKHYIKLASGSLYYAFETLEKDGFVRVVDVISDTNRPEKTIYSITDSGKQEFEELYFQQLLKKEHMDRPIYAALSFTSYIDQEKLLGALSKKIDETDAYLAKMKRLYQIKKTDHTIAHLSIIMRVIMHLKMELAWFRNLHQAAEEGRLTETDETYFERIESLLDDV
ncbi:PadR family transcriptional regulator [Bacillus sp. FJAT-42376]|uniref:PadR family transcriptional regulator n=1 Tax=Bacillus sp. FJAT-42376 TaxID=2014076 RepID=UPI000F4F7E9E|nr:PadR family transcriptional regulator [Bacillus sp. FJAT-42376]AZB40872.1 PadR family transcriptional regulator [Bacillus sp. FJAT-42376]